MIYQLSHTSEMESLPFAVTGKLFDNLMEFLIVLDNEYGKDRDVEHDDGGFVLFCLPGAKGAAFDRYPELSQLSPEWVNFIDCDPQYCAALYMPREDYSIVIVMPTADAPFDVSAAS